MHSHDESAAGESAPLPLPPDRREPWATFLPTMFWVGLNSFGGPVAQLGVMHQEAVEKRKWLTDGQFIHLLNFANVLPGPEALEVAIHLGYLRRGVLGGIVAGLLFIWPGFVSLTALAWAYQTYGRLSWVTGVLDGVRPVAVALIAAAAVRISSKVLKGRMTLVLTALAFVANAFLSVPFLFILCACGAMGILLRRYESASTGGSSFTRWVTLVVAIVLVGVQAYRHHRHIEAAPVVVEASSRAETDSSSRRLVDIAWMNTKAALLTFGGAYTVLPFLREQSVTRYRWLTDGQVADALALGETTPGPLVTVGVFISYVAGAFPGALVGCFFLFLPSFLFVLVLGRHIHRVETLPYSREFLTGVSAGTLGVILALSAALAGTMLTGAFAAALGLVTFVAVWRWKANVIAVVVAGGLIGLAKNALF